jgi:hypothetical protein
MQTYANLCILGAATAYCFTDVKHGGKIAKYLSLSLVAAFVVTEAAALIL